MKNPKGHSRWYLLSSFCSTGCNTSVVRSRKGAAGRLVIAALCLLFTAPMAWASPSGLNNIPTTDVTPPRAFVIQTWFNLIESDQTQQFVGFKTGVIKGLEFGIDYKAYGGEHGHATLQTKYSYEIMKDWLTVAAGIANVSTNRHHQGEVFPYAVATTDLKIFRLHFGFAPQPHNEAFFAGVDRTFTLFDRNLQLKADAIHINDKEDVLLSVGFLYELGRKDADNKPPLTGMARVLDDLAKNFILEGWVSMPTNNSDPNSFTLKLNYVIQF